LFSGGGEHLFDLRRDLARILVEHKMTGIEPDQFRRRQIAQIGFCSRRYEKRIILSPDDQRFWLILPECGMSGLIGRDIGFVVLKQIQLGQIHARPVK